MAASGIEPRFPRPLANTLPTRPMGRLVWHKYEFFSTNRTYYGFNPTVMLQTRGHDLKMDKVF